MISKLDELSPPYFNSIQVQTVYVIPSYNELSSLPILLESLLPHLTPIDLVIICDDSERNISQTLKKNCFDLNDYFNSGLYFSSSPAKSGRGASVRRGMKIALELCPNFKWLIECDADQSHRTNDILSMIHFKDEVDLLIGSRYLPGSRIEGWPVSRTLMSKLLNFVLPRVFRLPVTDLTNGLRRYSYRAVEQITANEVYTTSFIHLTEQALMLEKAELSIDEIPTTFINRKLGTSSVGLSELINSLVGVAKLLKRY